MRRFGSGWNPNVAESKVSPKVHPSAAGLEAAAAAAVQVELDRRGIGGGRDDRLASIETKICVIESNYATRLDVERTSGDIKDVKAMIAKAETSLVKWIVGVGIAVVGLVASIVVAAIKLLR